MEPPSFKQKSTSKPRRARKNSKPDTSNDFFNSNLDTNFNSGVTLSAPAQPPVSSGPGPNMNMNSNQGMNQNMNQNQNLNQNPSNQFYQPGQSQGQPSNNFMPQQNMGPPGQGMGPPGQANFMTPGQMGPGMNNMATGMMANMAMQYGGDLKNQGAAMVGKVILGVFLSSAI